MKKRGHPEIIRPGKWKKKFLLTMKLTLCFMLCLQFNLWASVSAQTKVSFDLKNASMDEFIAVMGKQTGKEFFYNSDLLEKPVQLNVNANNEEFTAVLERVLPTAKLTYEIINDVVVIKRLPQAPQTVEKKIVRGTVEDENGDPVPGATIMVLGTSVGTAANGAGLFLLEVPATVKSVMVSAVGMESQKITLEEGKEEYKVVLKTANTELDEVTVVSTGYQDVDRRRLTSAVTTLKMDDIKVDGLSTIDKMLEGHVPGMIFMQNSGQVGAAPKVRIRGTSTVLGNQEPLWVLDGVILQDPVNVDPASLNDLDFVNLLGNAISGLNPDDIEQIDVLKDAAATAIYGTRAANGVIVITTKKGHAGPPTVTYSLTGTINRRPHYREKNIYLMNSQERVAVSRELFERGMGFQGVSNWVGYEAAYMDYKAGRIDFNEFNRLSQYYEGINTDWFDILTDNSFSNKHTLSISGGSNEVRYRASIGYNDEQGVIKKEQNRTYTANLKLNGYFKKIDFEFSMTANNGKKRYTPSEVNALSYAYNTSRAIPAYNPDGTRWFYMRGGSRTGTMEGYPFNIENEMEKTYQHIDSYGLTFTGRLKYKILPSLNLEGTLSYTISSTNNETTYEEGSYYIAQLKKGGPGDASSECPLGGELNTDNTRMRSYTARLQANFNKTFKAKHALVIALGGELSSTSYNQYQSVQRGYYPDRGKSFAVFDDALLQSSEYRGYRAWLAKNTPTITDKLTNIVSAYFSASYTYDNRYTINFNTRMDGSNQFGSRSNEKLLPIWSVSGRWDIRQDFWPQSEKVNTLALKLSYGHQGNMLDNQTSRTIIQKGDYDAQWGDFTSTISNFANPDLKWETTHSYNAELDFSFFDGKIGGTVGYYYKKTTDAFLSKQVSTINGVANYSVNQGEVTNQGVEVSLQFTPINQGLNASGKRGFVWRFDPQIGQAINQLVTRAINNKNQILDDRVTYSDYLSGNIQLSGKPLGTFYAYRFKGLDPTDGHPLFYNTEEEMKDRFLQAQSIEEVVDLTMVEAGTRVPVLQGGFTNYFGYRQFGLSVNFSYSLGNKIRLLKLCSGNAINPYPEQNMRREFLNRWRAPGDENYTNIPSLVASDQIRNNPWWSSESLLYPFAGSSIYDMYDNSDIRVAKGNYLKLQSISFRYNVHDEICKKLHINSAYLSVTGTNLFTVCSKALKGQDPTQSGTSPTINLSVRPNYSLTLNVTF